jgi:hypothetical protein
MPVSIEWIEAWWADRFEEERRSNEDVDFGDYTDFDFYRRASDIEDEYDEEQWDTRDADYDAELAYDAFLFHFDVVNWSNFRTVVVKQGTQIGAVSFWMQRMNGRSYGKATSIGDL